ncbi:MAG: Gfo/Idh/MocA family protein [Anaerocolumna sp.]
MKTINWGIIGAGNISSKFATALKDMEGTNIRAIASRDGKKAEKFAKEFGADIAYGSYEELAKDQSIDVVYIGTPHTEHLLNTELCIKNNKAVLCEKPFTLNAKETRYLIDLAKEYKVFLMEAMWTKFLPVTNKVKEWVLEGKIGTMKRIDIGFGFNNPIDYTSRVFDYELAGGALLDMGVYPITYAIDIMGSLPVKVESYAGILENGVDEHNLTIFQFDNGALASLSSAVSVNVGKSAVFIGDKGKIVVDEFWVANKACVYDNDGDLIETFVEENRINGYEFEAYEVNKCFREGRLESDRLPLKDTLDIMNIMDDIRAKWGLKYRQELVD